MTKRDSKTVPGLFALGCLGGLMAVTHAAASSAIDQSNLAPMTDMEVGIVSSRAWGQTVQVGESGYLTRIDLSLAKTPGLTGNLYFQIHYGPNGGERNPEKLLVNRIIDIGSIPDNPGLSDPLSTPVSIDLRSELLWMEVGQKFTITTSRPGNLAEPWVSIRTTSGDPGYADGELMYRYRYSIDYEAWRSYDDGQYDMGFQTWVGPTPGITGNFTLERRPSFHDFASRVSPTSGWLVGGAILQVQGTSGTETEYRSILEFPLPELPKGAILTGARLRLYPVSITGQPHVVAHPYLGNGRKDASDVRIADFPSASTLLTSAADEFVIELGLESLLAAYDQAVSHIGYLFAVDNGYHSARFAGLSSNVTPFTHGDRLPALLIDYELPGYLAADLNGDGFVGIADLNDVTSHWNTYTPYGDITGDGFVGIEDLNTLLGNWNAGTPPVSGEGTAIPEPATAFLLSVMVGCSLCRNYRVA